MTRRRTKRRYVKAEVVTLIRDPKSGVMVLDQGGDLGPNAKLREERGEIIVTDRQLTEGGVVLCKGAYVSTPGAVEKLLGRLRRTGFFKADPDHESRLHDASVYVRGVIERARIRRRMTAMYQSAIAGGGEMSDIEASARSQIGNIAANIGVDHMAVLIDAIALENELSAMQEQRLLAALERLVSHLKL